MITEIEFYKYLSILIKAKRVEFKYTNEELSYISNVDVAKISLLQNEKQGCNAYTFYKILNSLGIDIFKNESLPILKDKALNETINDLEKIVNFLKCYIEN